MSSAVRIYVDADACPGVIKDIIIRAANSRKIPTIFVANKVLLLPVSEYLRQETVEAGLDKADAFIAENAVASDLVVTQDIPLAHQLVKKGIVAINPRGLIYTEDNIGDRISVRDLLTDLRDSGEITGGPKPFGDKDKRAFASSFDRVLTQLLRRFPARD